MAFRDYSKSPDLNTSIGDGGIYIGSNMLRNMVRPALQQFAADGRDLSDQLEQRVNLAKGDPGGNVQSTGTAAALQNQAIPVGTNQFFTEDGGRWIPDTVQSDADVAAHPNAIRKTFNARYFRRDAEQPLRLSFFGAREDSYNDTVMSEALAYLKEIAKRNSRTFWFESCPLMIGMGAFPFLDTIRLKQQVHLKGFTRGRETGMLTTFSFPPSKTGIIVNRQNTLDEFGSVADSGSAEGSILEGIGLIGGGGSAIGDAGGSGVVSRATCQLINVVSSYFPNHGFINAANESGSGIGNANESLLHSCSALHNGNSGFYFDGNNANACVTYGPMAGYNGGYGFQYGTLAFGGPVNLTIIGGHMVSNGKKTMGSGAGQTATSAVWLNGNCYYVVPGQAVGASTNSPNPAGVDNSWWYCTEVGANDGPYSDIPLWTSGIATREGGSAALFGGGEAWVSPYTEGRQGPGYNTSTAYLGGVHGAGRRGTFTG